MNNPATPMGDVRFDTEYKRIHEAVDPAEALRARSDEEVIAALAGASRDNDPYFANVLATEAMNRSRRSSAILTNLGEGVYAVNRSGVATFINDAGAALLGWHVEDFRGAVAHELVHPHCEGRADCPLCTVLNQGGTITSENDSFMGADGAERPVLSTVSALVDKGTVLGAVVVFRDQSALRRVLDELRSQAALLDLANSGIVACDMADRIRTWSRGAQELYGWSRDEAVGSPVNALLKTEFPQPLPDVRAELAREGHWEGELVHRTRTGKRVTVESRWALQRSAEGTPEAVMQINNDVTERKRAERRLRDSERRFRTAFDHAKIGMGLVSPQGEWLMVNRALCDIVGYDEAELLQLTFQDITHPEDLDADLDQVRRMLAGDIRTYELEKRYFHKDGRVVWILLSVSLVRDESGQPLYFISQIHDLTRRKRHERELRDAAAQVAELLRSTFGDVIVHDGAQVLAADPAAATLLGYEEGGLDGRRLDDVFAEGDGAFGEPITASRPLTGLREDGTRLRLDAQAVQLCRDGRKTWITGLRSRAGSPR